MRIEVLIDNGEPEIYPLNKSEITIGSGESCDIIIHDQGISRKHVKISVASDQFFIIDQGSSNGTFINEERLIPGRRIEFTSFFPVRLGASVLLCLLSDEETDGENLRELSQNIKTTFTSGTNEKNDSTRIINLSEFGSAKTSELVKKRQNSQSAKKKEAAKKVRPPEKSMKFPMLISLGIIAGAFYFHRSGKVAERLAEEARVKAEVEAKASRAKEAADMLAVTPQKPPPDFKIKSEFLLSKEKISRAFVDILCTTPSEIAMCDGIPFLREGKNGVLQVGTSLVFLISEKEWLEKGVSKFPGGQSLPPSMLSDSSTPEDLSTPAQATINIHGAEIEIATVDQIYRLAFLTLLKEKFSGIGKMQLEDIDLYFSFYKVKADGTPEVTKVFAVTFAATVHILDHYTLEFIFRQLKRQGYDRTIRDLDNFMTCY